MSTVLAGAVAVKQRHAQALRHALQQIDQENSELQRQYAEKIVLLQNASSTIASCMASFQQASETSAVALLAHDCPRTTRMLVAALQFSDSHEHVVSARFLCRLRKHVSSGAVSAPEDDGDARSIYSENNT